MLKCKWEKVIWVTLWEVLDHTELLRLGLYFLLFKMIVPNKLREALLEHCSILGRLDYLIKQEKNLTGEKRWI